MDCVDGLRPTLASPLCSTAFDGQQLMHPQPREKTFYQETPIGFSADETSREVSVVSSKADDIALNRDNKFMIRLGCNGEFVDIISSSESLGNELSGLISRYLANSGRQVIFDLNNNGNNDNNVDKNIVTNIVKNSNDVLPTNLNAEFQKSLKRDFTTGRTTYSPMELRKYSEGSRPTPDVESMINHIFQQYPELKRSV